MLGKRGTPNVAWPTLLCEAATRGEEERPIATNRTRLSLYPLWNQVTELLLPEMQNLFRSDAQSIESC
jgi:hypothetical protein